MGERKYGKIIKLDCCRRRAREALPRIKLVPFEQLDKMNMFFSPSFPPVWAVRARVQEKLQEFWQLGKLVEGLRRED